MTKKSILFKRCPLNKIKEFVYFFCFYFFNWSRHFISFQLYFLKLYFHDNHAKPKRFGYGNHVEPKRLGVASRARPNPTTNDVSPAETDNVLLVLPIFRPLWLLKNQGLCSFDPKTSFVTYSWPKTLIKHPRRHDKPNHVLKKPPPKTGLNQK